MEEARGERKTYKIMKREYKKVNVEKRRKERVRWERKIEGVKMEGQVWKVVGRGRRRRKRIN